MCSTPFGINERFTVGMGLTIPQNQCAQRLSASTNDSRGDERMGWSRHAVLNAFRHQRTIHGEQIGEHPEHPVVLNAFRHQRTIHHIFADVRDSAIRGAQRLSASTNDSPYAAGDFSGGFECSTPFGINERFTLMSALGTWPVGVVLNAFRHQRTIHLKFSPLFHDLDAVLNAFRHQRTIHGCLEAVGTAVVKCSTPFGINERFTPRNRGSILPLDSAQRLSASTNDSLAWKLIVSRSVTPCSTPFGINERFTAPAPTAGGCGIYHHVFQGSVDGA